MVIDFFESADRPNEENNNKSNRIRFINLNSNI
jgi:hypothetical protein